MVYETVPLTSRHIHVLYEPLRRARAFISKGSDDVSRARISHKNALTLTNKIKHLQSRFGFWRCAFLGRNTAALYCMDEQRRKWIGSVSAERRRPELLDVHVLGSGVAASVDSDVPAATSYHEDSPLVSGSGMCVLSAGSRKR